MHISPQLAGKVDASARKSVDSSFALGNNDSAESGSVHTPADEGGLQDIDFVEPVSEPRAFDPERRHKLIQKEMATWRQIFLNGLMWQICLARNPKFRVPRQKFVDCDGLKKRAVVYETLEPWWFEQEGVMFLRLNFGERKWSLKGKNPVIRIGSVDNLLPVLERLSILVNQREFDEIIEKMVIVSPR